MTSIAIKKQVDSYLPLLTSKQQNLVLEMIKTFLNVDSDTKRITKKQYNKESFQLFSAKPWYPFWKINTKH